MSSETRAEVFIIESLGRDDERRRREGAVLRRLLRMMGRKPEYRYIRTAKELAVMAMEFEELRYRYLHVSCHGNDGAFELTLDAVPFNEFAAMFRQTLRHRRLFLSACSIAQPRLAQQLFSSYESAPYSVTGPCEDIRFSDAAVTWASLYNLLFRDGSEIIEGKHIRDHLSQLCRLNGLSFVHYGRIRKKPYYRERKLPLRRQVT